MAKIEGNGLAKIATWDFKVNGQEEQAQIIDLASTSNNETLLDNKIAPGTSGSFNIIIDAQGSEVGIDYKINFKEETQKPTNLIFIYEDKEYSSVFDLEKVLEGTINANEENKTRILLIKWKWNYETGKNEQQILENDKIDTLESKKIRDYKFKVIVSGIQINPEQ